jgi:hypothetical protein
MDVKIAVFRLFENGVLKKIFGPKRNETTGGWGNC